MPPLRRNYHDRPLLLAHNGAQNIERADKLVQLVARQNGMRHPILDEIVAFVDRRLDANRKAEHAAA